MKRLLITIRSDSLADALDLELSAHFMVHKSNSGTDAWMLINRLQPDALVVDLRLHDDVFSMLRGCRFKPAVILAVTDFNSYDVRMLASDTGIQALVMMPCSARYIADLLRQATIDNPSPDM